MAQPAKQFFQYDPTKPFFADPTQYPEQDQGQLQPGQAGAPQAAAPQPADPLQSPVNSPAAAASAPTAQPSGSTLSARNRFFQNSPDASKAFMPPRPVGDFDNSAHPKLRGALADAFAGLAEYGGQRNGTPGMGMRFADRWMNQDQAQREYDARAPQLEAQARNQAFEQRQAEEKTAAETQEAQGRAKFYSNMGSQGGKMASLGMVLDPATGQFRPMTPEEMPPALKAHLQQVEGTLRGKGLKTDETGNIVPLSREEMTPEQQQHMDLTEATAGLKNAQAELAKAGNDPNSPKFKQAQQKLAIEQQKLQVALGNLNLHQATFDQNYVKGTTDENGNPVGLKQMQVNLPSADRLKRGDLARNAITNIQSIADIAKRRADLFGPVAGRLTSVQQMMGSNDTDIARLGTEIHNLALASNGAHGLRSHEAVADTENQLLNHFRTGPDAFQAGLQSMTQSLNTFVQDQKLGKRAGGNSSSAPTAGSQKVLSTAQLQQAAKDHNTSVDEAKRQAIAQGYTVK